ncbi:MAG TPA: peptidylprolyl isomerase [Bauldia sp.]|nr:peptidylprolyl isomerase [Bauldia sp.]
MTLAPSLRLALLAAALAIGGPALADDAAPAPASDAAPAAAPAAPAATDSSAAAAPAPASPTDIHAVAPTKADPNAVVATVDGDPITELELSVAEPTLHDALQQVPPDQQYTELLKAVINIHLMAKAAAAAGLDKVPENAELIDFTRERVLRQLYLSGKMAAISDAAVKAAYDAQVATFVPGDEVHVEHILVSTEAEAKDIISQLDKGANFEDLAKQKSSDSSSQSGGDLGWIGKGQTVQPFEDAAFALDVGKYTETPVQSQFGWHVIKMLEKRKSSPPALSDVQDQIRSGLQQQLYLDETNKLFAAAKIVVVPEANPAPAATPPADGSSTAAPAPATPAPADSGTAAPAAPAAPAQ